MSVIDRPAAAPFGAISIFRLVAAGEALLEGVRMRLRARATERALEALSDGQLRDIGLHRGEIAEIAAALAGRR